MHLITPCSSTGPTGTDLVWGILELTEQVIDDVQKRLKMLDTLKDWTRDASAIEFHDARMVFTEDDLDRVAGEVDLLSGGELLNSAFDHGLALTQHELDLEGLRARTECERMVVLVGVGVHWSCMPKHTDLRVETRPIDPDTWHRVALLL